MILNQQNANIISIYISIILTSILESIHFEQEGKSKDNNLISFKSNLF